MKLSLLIYKGNLISKKSDNKRMIDWNSEFIQKQILYDILNIVKDLYGWQYKVEQCEKTSLIS